MEPININENNPNRHFYEDIKSNDNDKFPMKPVGQLNFYDFKYKFEQEKLSKPLMLQQFQPIPNQQPMILQSQIVDDGISQLQEKQQPIINQSKIVFNQQLQPQENQQISIDPIKKYQAQLKRAYDIYLQGNKNYKEYSLHEALDKYTTALDIVNNVYPNIINENKFKTTTDQFLKILNQTIKGTTIQIKNKYQYKPTCGFASYDEHKEIKYVLQESCNTQPEIKKQYVVREIPSFNTNANKKNDQTKANTAQSPVKDNNKTKQEESKSIVTNDLRDKVLSEIIDSKPGITFTDVIGLASAKQVLKEIIVIPNLRPDLFTGLRAPPRGLLLFGPPGTGKTMIAKAVATECNCTFFNISASSLTSKYLGESEKLVRALFELAFEKEPSVVFIDEIESILSKRNENENEAMKRLKTEFLIQFDGVGSSQTAHVLVIGATNRPQELDPAVIRRLPKRVYIGPFDEEDRKVFVKTIITQNDNTITDEQFDTIAKSCINYSNSDLKELCREAAYEPLREISTDMQEFEKVDKLRPICFEDFNKAIKKIRGTLTKPLLDEMQKWNQQFGALN